MVTSPTGVKSSHVFTYLPLPAGQYLLRCTSRREINTL